MLPPIIPINHTGFDLSLRLCGAQHNGQPPLSELALVALLFEQVAVAHVEDQAAARPLRGIELMPLARRRVSRDSDKLTVPERTHELLPSRNRRVPRARHGR